MTIEKSGNVNFNMLCTGTNSVSPSATAKPTDLNRSVNGLELSRPAHNNVFMPAWGSVLLSLSLLLFFSVDSSGFVAPKPS